MPRADELSSRSLSDTAAGGTVARDHQSDIPAVCFLEDVARILRTSRSTIKRLRACGTFPIPELPSIDKRPRWSGDVVRRFLEQSQAGPRWRRKVG